MSAARRAEAWYTLAEVQRALHHADARGSYKQCVAYNNEAFTCKALLHLADLAWENKEYRDAEEVLLQIVNGLVSDRPAHEQALLKLANLYFRLEQYDKAATWYRELMKQYPAHASILSVRDQLGECYFFLGKAARTNAESPESVTGEKKELYRRLWLENVEARLQVYQQLKDDLEARALVKPLPAAEDKLRRKAAFVVADCYYDLPYYFKEAHLGYLKIFQRYPNQPDGLWACQRLVTCWLSATTTKYPALDVVRESADHAVEHCLLHLEDYERAGAYQEPQEKADWQKWLQDVRGQIQSQKRGGQ